MSKSNIFPFSSTSNAGFRHWLRVTRQQSACNCHQVITRWCQQELSSSGADEVTWILNDIPDKGQSIGDVRTKGRGLGQKANIFRETASANHN